MKTYLLAVILLISCIHAEREFQQGRSWDDFVYPTVTVVDKDQGTTKGSQLVRQLFPDLEGHIKEIAKGVCQKLYKDINEVPVFDELIFELEYRDGVAYKAGNPPRITVNLSTKYLEEQYNKLGEEGVTYEISGVNWHELTHGYQYVPKQCGGYQNGTEFFGFIEGTADAVRILAGFHDTRKPYPGGKWTDGYTTAGFFIEWVQTQYDADFLYKLNKSCKTIIPWSYDKACTEIIGKGVQDLWDEYQWFLKDGGKEAVAQFTTEKRVLCKNEKIRFINRSFNNPETYEWTFEGGSPSTSSEENPTVMYETPGTYDVTLLARNSHGQTTQREKSYITVANQVGTMITLTTPSGKISCDVSSPFPGEDVTQLLDQNGDTKFCVKDGTLWLKYDCEKKAQLYAYSFTSARDADWRDPQSWTLSGSTDGYQWTSLDRETAVQFIARKETKLFVVNETDQYQYYRWDIQAKTDTMFQLADLTLFGIDNSVEIANTTTAVHTKQEIRVSGKMIHFPPKGSIEEVSLYSLNGARVSQKQAPAGVQSLNFSELSPGCYIVRAKVKVGSEVQYLQETCILQ